MSRINPNYKGCEFCGKEECDCPYPTSALEESAVPAPPRICQCKVSSSGRIYPHHTPECQNSSPKSAAPASPEQPARVQDHKWFDPECHEKGCQSLLYKQWFKELVELAKAFRGKVHIFQLSDEEMQSFNKANKRLAEIEKYL